MIAGRVGMFRFRSLWAAPPVRTVAAIMLVIAPLFLAAKLLGLFEAPGF